MAEPDSPVLGLHLEGHYFNMKMAGGQLPENIKNPDPEEIKYELSDFHYHSMVLMVEKGVTWEDITRELANRE